MSATGMAGFDTVTLDDFRKLKLAFKFADDANSSMLRLCRSYALPLTWTLLLSLPPWTVEQCNGREGTVPPVAI